MNPYHCYLMMYSMIFTTNQLCLEINAKDTKRASDPFKEFKYLESLLLLIVRVRVILRISSAVV